METIPEYVQKMAQKVKDGEMGEFKSLDDPGVFFGKMKCQKCKQVMWHIGWDKAEHDLFACATCESTVSIKCILY